MADDIHFDAPSRAQPNGEVAGAVRRPTERSGALVRRLKRRSWDTGWPGSAIVTHTIEHLIESIIYFLKLIMRDVSNFSEDSAFRLLAPKPHRRRDHRGHSRSIGQKVRRTHKATSNVLAIRA